MVVSEHDIREEVARYVSGQVSLDDFQVWFVPRAWEILETGVPASGSAAEIELLLAEYSGGDLSEEDLRDALIPYASIAKVQECSLVASWETRTSAQPVSIYLSDPLPLQTTWVYVSKTKEALAA
ncbi:MAG TPA: hypothetical protein VFQ62_09160 [Methylomirabilota bacterium]|jgi:hypothetical protein|nr:hypothetical protein [Methylomirabilota bacterium]